MRTPYVGARGLAALSIALSALGLCVMPASMAAERHAAMGDLNRYVQMHTGYVHRAQTAADAATGAAASRTSAARLQAPQREPIGDGSGAAVMGTQGAAARQRF